MLQVRQEKNDKVNQGDIIRNVEFIEDVIEINGEIKISKIVFPLVVVLTQECDLTWDHENRRDKGKKTQDKYLFSVIVAPIYNYEHFILGKHLSELKLSMQTISSNTNKTDNKNLKHNETPRYHYLEFDENVNIVPSVIDFKHYFTVQVSKLEEWKKDNFVCTVDQLYRERISQRFANYLSRIGLPGE